MAFFSVFIFGVNICFFVLFFLFSYFLLDSTTVMALLLSTYFSNQMCKSDNGLFIYLFIYSTL